MAEQRKLITDVLNTFFSKNTMAIGNNAPTSGAHIPGDIVIKSNPAANQPIGWICTVAGAPGTWVEFGSSNAIKLANARKFTIGNTEKTFDGSADVSWSLSEIGAAPASHGTHLTLGTSSSNAYRGDYGNTAYTHSQAAHAPSNAQKNSDITKAEIEAKLTGNITSHTHSSYATTTTTGTLSSLKTSSKGSLVAAINEVFQSGVSVKEELVDTLTSKGLDVSTSNTFTEIISEINNRGGILPAWLKQPVCVYTPKSLITLSGFSVVNNTPITNIQNIIYLFIGTNLFKYDTLNDKASTISVTKPYTSMVGGHAETINGTIYITCNSGNCYSYNASSNTFTTKAAKSDILRYGNSCSIGNNMYIVCPTGTSTPITSKAMYKYDTSTNTWTTMTAFTQALRDVSATADDANNIIYIGGGSNGSTAYNKLYKYAVSTGTTTSTAGLCYCDAELEYFNGKIYSVGGNKSTDSNVTLAEFAYKGVSVYTISGNSKVNYDDILLSVGMPISHESCIVGNCIYLFSGQTVQCIILND